MESQQVLAAVFVLAFAAGAAAHGGKLHEWPSTPSGSNYIRSRIASCNNWVTGNGRVAYFLTNGSAAPSSTPSITVKGNATIWQYLYGNCSVPAGSPPSASVEINVTVTRSGQPVSGLTVDGVATTESCGARLAPPYYLNLTATPRDSDDNILWFHNFTTNSTGRIHGSGANDGRVSTSGDNAAKAIVIVNTKTAESLACCDLTLAGPATTDWAATLQGKGKVCEDDAHGAKPAAAAAAATANSHDAHAGHDQHANHDSHDGHDHGAKISNSSRTAGPPAATATSGATAVSVARILPAAALTAAMLAML